MTTVKRLSFKLDPRMRDAWERARAWTSDQRTARGYGWRTDVPGDSDVLWELLRAFRPGGQTPGVLEHGQTETSRPTDSGQTNQAAKAPAAKRSDRGRSQTRRSRGQTAPAGRGRS